MSTQNKTFQFQSIGTVQRNGDDVQLQLKQEFVPGLAQLEYFSHAFILWVPEKMLNDEHRNILQTKPPYAPDKVTGVFACRSEYRPNPIAVSVCKIKHIDRENGVVEVYKIDAFENSPILDIKPYFPVCDRVQEASIPEWFEGWPEWMPDQGIGLEYD